MFREARVRSPSWGVACGRPGARAGPGGVTGGFFSQSEFATPRSEVGDGEFVTPRSSRHRPTRERSSKFKTPRESAPAGPSGDPRDSTDSGDGETSARSDYYTEDSSAGDLTDRSSVQESDDDADDLASARSTALDEQTSDLSRLRIDRVDSGDSGGFLDARSAPLSSRSDAGRGDFATPREFSEDEVREAFNAFDSDGDGLLTPHDVRLFFEALGEQLSSVEVKRMMTTVDRGGKGKLDFLEFFELATSR